MAFDWLTLAMGVLPRPPARLTASRAEGGAVEVELIDYTDGGLLIRMDLDDAEATSALTITLDLPERGEYAVAGTLRTTIPVSAHECDVLLEVDEVMRWKKRPRIELDVPATVVLSQGADASERAVPIPVRLLDVSPQGVAFSTASGFRRGDRLRLATTLGDRPVQVEARVLQAGRAVFGRRRVSCTFTASDQVAAAIEVLLRRGAA
jgi:hypothetical protein